MSGFDQFANGCPFGLDPLDLVLKMTKKGIVLNCIGCEPTVLPYKAFFTSLAFKTGGQYLPLINAEHLSQAIIMSTIEELSLLKLEPEAEREIHRNLALGLSNEDLLTSSVEKCLKNSGSKTQSLYLKNSPLSTPSLKDLNLSKSNSLKEFNKLNQLEQDDDDQHNNTNQIEDNDKYSLITDNVSKSQSVRLVRRILSKIF